MFDKCFDYASSRSTCIKVSVGACAVLKSGEVYFSSNYGDHNCKEDGTCYKYLVTGIYESCEETRKFCASTHAEINLINKVESDGKSMEGAVVYCTRYPCEKCSINLVKSKIKEVHYCGKQEISENSKRWFDKSGIKVFHNPDIDYEEDWWTTKFYNNAYDIVKNRKYPIIIPSYNRPGIPSVMKGFLSHMDEQYNYPIYIFVRMSQYDDYINQVGKMNYVTIVGIDDEHMIGAGAARKMSLKWMYDHGYDSAFSFDDDLLGITYTVSGLTGNGDPKSKCIKNPNVSKVLAMWQLSMEKAVKEKNVLISGVMPMGFSWKSEYCQSDHSMLWYRGLPSQAVCLNIKGLVEAGLNYKENKECGHEDLDLVIRIIESGNSICVFPFMAHSAPPMSVENWNFGSMVERFTHQQEIMKKNHGEKEWVKFADKRGIPQVSINWLRVRRKFGITDYIFDIWQDGRIINS